VNKKRQDDVLSSAITCEVCGADCHGVTHKEDPEYALDRRDSGLLYGIVGTWSSIASGCRIIDE
jgi:hypothetical protein